MRSNSYDNDLKMRYSRNTHEKTYLIGNSAAGVCDFRLAQFNL